MKPRKNNALLLGLLGAMAGGAWAQESPWGLTGSVKTYFYSVGSAPLGGSGGWVLDSPFRLRLLYKPDDVLTLEAAEELESLDQSGTGGSTGTFLTAISPYRLADLSNPVAGPSSGDGERLLQDLDRLSIAIHQGKWEMTLGRQVVSFGSAHLVNPTDVLAPFNFQARDQENRSGVDALRVRYAWGDFGEMDAGYVAGKDARWDQSALFVKPHFHLGGMDVSLLSMLFRENHLLGVDLQGSLGGAGWWSEGAWVWPKNGDTAYGRLTLGVDQYFAGDLDLSVEYHFNGAGQQDASRYLDLNPTAYGAGTVYFLGRHYLAPALSWQADPLLSLQGQAVMNLTDGSWWLVLHAEYNALENLYADVGMAQPVGSGLEGFLPTSEFGLYPAFQYADLRFYF
ncbi:MAG TPA: hypothetical protein VHE12_03605 [bacterium]|nr:hypothetical protein [bacterium]